MDDLLVRYLLTILDADEQRALEEQLLHDVTLRDQLESLRKTMAPLSLDADLPEPPSSLVLTTLARVAEEHCRRPRPIPAPRPVPSSDGTVGRRWFRRADVLVAAVLLILVGGLAFPWLVRQWQASQIQSCKRNLNLFWTALEFHSNISQTPRAFPQLEKDGPFSYAGIVVPILHDNRLLDPDASILCPALGKRPPDGRTVEELKLLWSQDTQEFRTVIRDVGGSYAYPLGYQEGQRLIGLYRGENDGQPLMADAPNMRGGYANSENHGRRGQNVLFVGGNVRWCTTRTVGPDGDDIFVNKNNEVAAGLDRYDSVLGVGDARPFPPSCRLP